jgi:putative FmdB family regulatory protein
MALYGFACERCGPFEVRRPMSEAAAPAPCPECGDEARRIFSPPRLALLGAPLRAALNGEERSGHEPDVVTTKNGKPMPHRHSPAPPWVLSH